MGSFGIRGIAWLAWLTLAATGAGGEPAATGAAASAATGGSDASGEGPGWELRVAPYVWALSLGGDATVGDVQVEVDTPFRDILSKLNGALFGTVEYRRGRLLAVGDLIASGLEDEFNTDTASVSFGPTTVSRGRLSVAVPRVGITVGPAEVRSKTTMLGFAFYGGYRVLSRPMSGLFGDPLPDDLRSLNVDLLVGGRYWNIDQEIDVSIPPIEVPGFSLQPSLALPNRVLQLRSVSVPGVTLGGADVEAKEGFEWIDPMLAIRVESDLSSRFEATLGASVGGFGIGSAANLAWQSALMLRYRLSERWKLELGYAALGLDKDLGSANLDLVMHGPVIGVVYRFGPGAVNGGRTQR